jgi:hypothetical protein
MWGVQAASIRRHEVTEELIADAARRVVELGWVKPGAARRDHRRAAERRPGDDEPAADPAALTGQAARASARRTRPPRRTELGDRGVAVEPLARDPVEVAARAQLRDHREREHLHAPAEDVVGRRVSWRIWPKYSSAGRSCRSSPGSRSRASARPRLVGRVPPGHARKCSSTRSGRTLRLGKKPTSVPSRMISLGVALDHGALRSAISSSTELGGIRLNRPKSKNATRPSSSSIEVAGVRVAGELVVAVQAAEVEAEDDLADAVALGLRVALELLEAGPSTNSLTSTRSRESEVTTSGTTMNGWPRRSAPASAGSGPRARSRAPLDPLADLLADRLDVEPGAIRLSRRRIIPGSACRRAPPPPRPGTGP